MKRRELEHITMEKSLIHKGSSAEKKKGKENYITTKKQLKDGISKSLPVSNVSKYKWTELSNQKTQSG